MVKVLLGDSTSLFIVHKGSYQESDLAKIVEKGKEHLCGMNEAIYMQRFKRSNPGPWEEWEALGITQGFQSLSNKNQFLCVQDSRWAVM